MQRIVYGKKSLNCAALLTLKEVLTAIIPECDLSTDVYKNFENLSISNDLVNYHAKADTSVAFDYLNTAEITNI